MLDDVGSNACAGVTKHYFDLLILTDMALSDLQLAAVWHCIAAIVHEIEEDLMQALPIRRDAWQVLFECDRCLDVPGFEHWSHQQPQLPDRSVNVGCFKRYLAAMRALEQTLDCLDNDAELRINYLEAALGVRRVPVIAI